MIRIQTRSIGEFKGLYNRGTDSILSSPHFKDMRTKYMRNRLESNFLGPREWYLLARKKMTPKTCQEIRKISIAAKRISVNQILLIVASVDGIPDMYPFVSKEMLNEDKSINFDRVPEDQLNKWEQFRLECANRYPSSVYAIEERVIESWNAYCGSDTPSRLEIPESVIHGGFKISLLNEYQQKCNALEKKPDGACTSFYKAVQKLCANSNPWEKPDLPGNYLHTLKLRKMLRTNVDFEYVLPLLLQRWRQLSIGNLNPLYQTPSSSLTDHIITLACEKNVPQVALHLLRHKAVYKLSPKMASIEKLMGSLAKRHFKTAEKQESHDDPPAEEDQKSKPSTSRKLSRSDYPFRQGPRFYFYQDLPFVLSPEPGLLSEIKLPRLPTDNETKRLLPDDQRKKLAMMIEEQEKALQYSLVKEGEAMKTLTEMYQLYAYATEKSPYYYGMEPSSLLIDYLFLAGGISGVEQGKERNLGFYAEYLNNNNNNCTERFSRSGLAGLLAADEKNEHVEDYQKLLSVVADKDNLQVGYLAGVYFYKALMERGSDTVANEMFDRLVVKTGDSANPEISHLIKMKTNPVVEEVIGILQGRKDNERASKLMQLAKYRPISVKKK